MDPPVQSNTDSSSAGSPTPRKLSPQFLDAVNSQLVVFFAGSTARDKPSADLLAALSGATLLQTDERGTIEVMVEAEGVKIRSGK